MSNWPYVLFYVMHPYLPGLCILSKRDAFFSFKTRSHTSQASLTTHYVAKAGLELRTPCQPLLLQYWGLWVLASSPGLFLSSTSLSSVSLPLPFPLLLLFLLFSALLEIRSRAMSTLASALPPSGITNSQHLHPTQGQADAANSSLGEMRSVCFPFKHSEEEG